MNIQELGYNLKKRRLFKKIPDRRILLDMTVHEMSCLENGAKCSLKSLNTYLEIIDACLMFQMNNIDKGMILIDSDKISLRSNIYEKVVSQFNCDNTLSLLRYINEYGYRIRIRYNTPGLEYKPNPYPYKNEWMIISKINKLLLKEIEKKNVSLEALARDIHITKSGLENFLYSTLNYDFKLVDVIAKRLGCVMVCCVKNQKHFTLEYIDKKLFKVFDKSNSDILKPQYSIFSEQSNHKIQDIASILNNMGFVKVFFAQTGNAIELLNEHNLDNTGKKLFFKYSPRELEEIVKWRSNGYGKNLICDYCRTKGPVKFYSTTDRREIQLCRQCKEKIHPTNNYIHIIYTPTGGQK